VPLVKIWNVLNFVSLFLGGGEGKGKFVPVLNRKAIKIYVKVALDEGEWSASGSNRFTPEE
jgi:hypothetical protein